MTDPLAPGATIGILGGGQLGRMLAVAAARLGLRVHIYDPDEAPVAAEVAAGFTRGDWSDTHALAEFAQAVDVVTYEFENIPPDALDAIEAHAPIRPTRRALATSHDRLTEKRFLTELGLTTAPFAPVATQAELEAALSDIGAPAILKTRRLGYDGKGQARIMDLSEAADAFGAMQGADAILEGFVDFSAEISMIVARAADGAVACYDPGRNHHEDGILRRTQVPSGLPSRLTTDAALMAGRIVTALDYIGVMGVEFFVTAKGLVVNEIAPRVHNSGHWTQNGCLIDQFEQHIRAVAGWPLGDGSRHTDITMDNLIGADMEQLSALRADPGVALHLYGKSESRPGRKMGHVNRVTRSPE